MPRVAQKDVLVATYTVGTYSIGKDCVVYAMRRHVWHRLATLYALYVRNNSAHLANSTVTDNDALDRTCQSESFLENGSVAGTRELSGP